MTDLGSSQLALLMRVIFSYSSSITGGKLATCKAFNCWLSWDFKGKYDTDPAWCKSHLIRSIMRKGKVVEAQERFGTLGFGGGRAFLLKENRRSWHLTWMLTCGDWRENGPSSKIEAYCSLCWDPESKQG